VAINDLYTLTVCCSTEGGPFTFSQDYQQISGSNDADTLDKACVRWNVDSSAQLEAMLAQTAFINECEMQPATGVDEVPGLLQFVNRIGDVVSDSLPTNVAAIISQLTNSPNSRANGRIFLAGIPESAMENGIMSAAYSTLVQTFATSMQGNLVVTGPPAAEFKPVVISRYLNGALRIPPVPHDIVANTAKRQLRQQRRRTTRSRGLSI